MTLLIPLGLPKLANKKQAAFLAAYAECGVIRKAEKLAGVSRVSHYEWMHNDPGYAEAFKVADEMAVEQLEEEARRRAVDGIPHPVYYKGKRVDTYQEYSDLLLIFKLKGARPEKYKDNPIVNVDARRMDVHVTAETLDALRAARQQLLSESVDHNRGTLEAILGV